MIETLTIHPAPNPNDKANKKEWTPRKFLKRGEYDLVNISLIGKDPNSGWTYDQCQDAWDAALKDLNEMIATAKPWHLIKQVKMRLLAAALYQRQGFP